MGSGFAKMKKQARMMEQQIELMKATKKNQQIIGLSGNGLVTVTLTGEKQVINIKIKPECVDINDLEGLQDLIKAAFDHAHEQIDAEEQAGVSIPEGFSFPF